MPGAHMSTLHAKLSVERGPTVVVDGLPAIEPLVSLSISLTMSTEYSTLMQTLNTQYSILNTQYSILTAYRLLLVAKREVKTFYTPERR
jgi:hypothetical protein